MIGLGDLPGGTFESGAQSVSADGSVITGYSSSYDPSFYGGWQAFRWTAATGIVGIGNLPGGGEWSFGAAISADGNTIAGGSNSGPFVPEGFRWTISGGLQATGDLSGGFFSSAAWGISGDGSLLACGGNSANGYEAFYWTPGTGPVAMGDLPGGSFDSQAIAVSSDGTTIAGRATSASGTEAFRWTLSGGMVGLGDLPGGGFESNVYGLSGNGSIAVGYGTTVLGQEATLWRADIGMVRLSEYLVAAGATNLAGWTLQQANAISTDGTTIVGFGINPLGQREAWRASISSTFGATAPEPSTLALSLLGILGVCGSRSRKHRSLPTRHRSMKLST
jgi:uncharacterized membrane protein